MELRQLLYFVTVADELHFGRAAERLHIVQPAVSQQIRRLERELGVELFDRSPRRVRLTAAGERFLPEARATLAAAERARAVAAEHGEPGALRLGTSEGLGDHLDRVLGRLAALAPELTVRLGYTRTQARLDQVRDGQLDAAFVRGIEHSPGLRLEPIWEDRLLVALPADHGLAGGAHVDLADLAGLPLRLVERRLNPPLVDRVLTACQDRGFSPTMAPPADRLQNTLALVGVGTPSWTLAYEAQARVLRGPRVAFRPSRPPISITSYLAVPEEGHPRWLDPLLRACRDHDS
ncbi:LysR family transcriptional regulator [Pseudonocardia acaciae]|uniref:LysR substrate-binding domain-containing protein n=1 Tax=Pseudonocardia acaciae TaxID=551276 RepID=UPI00048DC38C|nr:LysR family transcriptional regulator [Pseudonocardia acaciae]